MMKNPVDHLRFVAKCEAVSFLLLIGLAMPLKYIWGMPTAVRWIGMIHGLLFVWFCISLAMTMGPARWSFGKSALVFVAALIPFGPFLIDSSLKQDEEQV